MDKIEDIEMIGLVIVEQSKPINKIGITKIDRGPPTDVEFSHRNKRHDLWCDRLDS